jgi:hypothetical protein
MRFTGREKELATISDCIDPSSDSDEIRQIALVGIGGVGKTETALEYVSRRLDKFPIILWAHADTRAKLNTSFANFAVELGLVTSATEVDFQFARDQVKAHLQSRSESASVRMCVEREANFEAEHPWLMVFDNADGEKLFNARTQDSEDSEDGSILNEYWPRGKYGSVLITARARASLASFTGSFCEIDRLEESDAIELLLKLGRVADNDENRELAKSVCQRLGCLPLGVASASQLLNVGSHSLGELTRVTNEELIEDAGNLFELANRNEYAHSLKIVWKIHYDMLKRASLNAVFLLNILAFLDPDNIREKLISKAAARSIDERLFWLRNEQAFRIERTNLYNSTLVMRNAHHAQMQMHRLSQSYVHLRMSLLESQTAFDAASELVYCIWPFQDYEKRHDKSLWEAQESCVDHIAHLAERYRLSTFKESTTLRSGPSFARLIVSAAW